MARGYYSVTDKRDSEVADAAGRRSIGLAWLGLARGDSLLLLLRQCLRQSDACIRLGVRRRERLSADRPPGPFGRCAFLPHAPHEACWSWPCLKQCTKTRRLEPRKPRQGNLPLMHSSSEMMRVKEALSKEKEGCGKGKEGDRSQGLKVVAAAAAATAPHTRPRPDAAQRAPSASLLLYDSLHTNGHPPKFSLGLMSLNLPPTKPDPWLELLLCHRPS